MNLDHQEHGYEELREIVVVILLSQKETGVDRFEKVLERISLEFLRQDASENEQQRSSGEAVTQLHPNDAELVLEIIWDLFRQGIVTLGLNSANPGWPWLRLSRFGECALQQGLYRFHNKAAFMKALRSEVIDISPDAALYAREAVAAFYTDCLLSTCVMLSVAAETEFLQLLATAKSSNAFGKYFSRIGDGLNIRAKIMRFGEAIKPILTVLPDSATCELGDALNTMQAIIRTTRNESGDPAGPNPPSRDQVYVYLQLFIPFAEQLMRLRRELAQTDYPRLVGSP